MRAFWLILLFAVVLSASCGSAGNQRSISSDAILVEIDENGSVRILEKATGVDWRLGSPRVRASGGKEYKVDAVGEITREGKALRYAGPKSTAFAVRLAPGGKAVEYAATPGPEVEEVFLLDGTLPLGAGKDDYYAIPHRMGILLRAEGDESYRRRFPAYRTGDGYSMAMAGVVRNGSALLLHWDDAHTDIVVDYESGVEPELRLGLALRKTARGVHLAPIGKGGYVELAKAYREVAARRGFRKTLAEKARENPNVGRFFGAADFKPFLYMRRAPNTRWNQSAKTEYALNFTFDEAARLAEHFRNDLGIDRALFVLNGWITAGYDNQHPDILPAAEAIGGNAGLAECARRVKQAGFLFGLHDNYQDMYQDAPSWDESLLIKNEDGSIRQGGVWAGGQCWLICSRKAVELASRPRNVPGVVQLCRPDVYFSDTIFAAGLYECHDPNHPTTIEDDIRYKQELCDYIRGQVGLFGSEEGREWGVAHADYFEGLMSHKTGFNRRNSFSAVVPMFEIVFSDCIPMYGHQSDRPRPDEPEKILDHILYAEMPVYYFGNHTYWKDGPTGYEPRSPEKMLYAQGGGNSVDQFIKNTYAVLSPLHRMTATLPMEDHQFLQPDGSVQMTRFGADVNIWVNYGPRDRKSVG